MGLTANTYGNPGRSECSAICIRTAFAIFIACKPASKPDNINKCNLNEKEWHLHMKHRQGREKHNGPGRSQAAAELEMKGVYGVEAMD